MGKDPSKDVTHREPLVARLSRGSHHHVVGPAAALPAPWPMIGPPAMFNNIWQNRQDGQTTKNNSRHGRKFETINHHQSTIAFGGVRGYLPSQEETCPAEHLIRLDALSHGRVHEPRVLAGAYFKPKNFECSNLPRLMTKSLPPKWTRYLLNLRLVRTVALVRSSPNRDL